VSVVALLAQRYAVLDMLHTTRSLDAVVKLHTYSPEL
jgi:hypothetical protein